MTSTANTQLDPAANISAIIAALPKATGHYYCAGSLYVAGVTQAELDAAIAARDLAADALAQAKRAKLLEVNVAAEQALRGLAKIDAYPEFERQTWPIQQSESASWFAAKETDRSADLVPWCALAAAQRGLELDEFMRRVQAKVAAFRALSAALSGQRQAFEDQIEAAQTHTDLQGMAHRYAGLQEAITL